MYRFQPPDRRSFVRLSAGAGLAMLSDGLLFGASDFWNRKEPAGWSAEEIEQLRTKSPWSKKVRATLSGRGAPRDRRSVGGAGSMSAESNGMRGGGGNGGLGDFGGGGGRGGRAVGDSLENMAPGASAPQGPELIVRWESAAPLLEAEKTQLPPSLRNRYVISVTGVPPRVLAMLVSGGGGRQGDAQQPPDPAAEAKARQERILHAVALSTKGHDPQAADTILQTSDKQTLLFGFPKQNLPIAAADKEIDFEMKFGVMTAKVKFATKEMLYKGALAL